MKVGCALGACAFTLMYLTPSAAMANVERFAVIIGNNQGLPSDETLQYAESDATRVFEVLRDLGGFQPVDMVLLRDENADTVQRTLIAVNDRIRAAVSLPNGQAMLFVYYSGHADADDLHLGETRLGVAQLAQLARGSAANFRLIVLDACRSGALTRLKGGRILAPFELPGERMPEDGFAFLTASAANEDAQESDELKASFFTHAFVSGMLGPADRDANGEVALEEAYGYAYDATIRATSRTFGGTQHPAFRYDFRGQGSVVLTRPDSYAQQRANVHFPPKLNFLLMRGAADGPVVAELEEGAVQRSLSLRPGPYFVRARGREVMYEGPLTAAAGSSQSIELGRLSRIEYARLVRKGRSDGSDGTVVHSLEVGGLVRSVMPNAETACFGASLGYALDFASFGGRARFNACHSSFENRLLTAATNAYDLDLRLYRAWDLSLLALEIGLGGGVSLFTGHYETRGLAPSATSLAPFLAVGGGALFDLGWRGVFLHLDVAAETHFMRLRDDAFSDAEWTAHVAVRGGLSLGKHF
jgi:hypothetical protein